MHVYVLTQQKDDVFSSSAEGKWNKEHIIPSHLDTTISPNRFHSPLVNTLFPVYATLR